MFELVGAGITAERVVVAQVPPSVIAPGVLEAVVARELVAVIDDAGAVVGSDVVAREPVVAAVDETVVIERVDAS